MGWPMGTRRNFCRVGGKPKQAPTWKKAPLRRKNSKKKHMAKRASISKIVAERPSHDEKAHHKDE